MIPPKIDPLQAEVEPETGRWVEAWGGVQKAMVAQPKQTIVQAKAAADLPELSVVGAGTIGQGTAAHLNAIESQIYLLYMSSFSV